jgi:hexokinase
MAADRNHTLEEITENFRRELKLAQEGKKTSLPFIRHHLSLKPKVKKGEIFQVLRIGGSIYQNALVKRINGKIAIVKSVQKPLPIFTTEEVFLSFIEKVLDKHVDHLALNFAYPVDPVSRDGYLDGKLIMGTKEHSYQGLVGKLVGHTIEHHVKEKLQKTIHVALANDTVCLVLSGLTQFPWKGLVGGIVGTGLNFAIFLDQGTIVNLEAANFDKFPQSAEGKLIDKASTRPKSALIEKEIAGGYLYQHFNIRLHKEGLDFPDIKSTKEMDAVAFKEIPLISLLAREVSDHSSSLVACQIAGIAQFLKRDCVFVVEGSLFWKGWRYKENVSVTVRQLASQYQVSFVFIEESGVLGAAKLLS